MDYKIHIGEIIYVLGPYILPWVMGLLSLVLTAVGARIYKLTGIKLTAEQQAEFRRVASESAARIWARSEPTISSEVITVSDPRIAKAVNDLLPRIPLILKDLGITSDKAQAEAARLILSHLGNMQASSTSIDQKSISIKN